MNRRMRFLVCLSLAFWFSPSALGQSQADPPAIPRSDITFQTLAVNYPADTEVKITMLGTTQFAGGVKGRAAVERRNGVTGIVVNIGRLPRPSQVGPAAATYVLWAITPEGQADNLGEFRKRPSDTWDNWLGSELKTATRHRKFSLVITAEPYYLVSSPSRLVVVANQRPIEPSVAADENTISFSGDADFENKIVTPSPAAEKKDPKYPIELLQARRAVDIARYYGADTHAKRLFAEAEAKLTKAEGTYQGGYPQEAAETADEAIRLADRARKVAVGNRKAETDRKETLDRDASIAELEEQLKDVKRLRSELAEERAKRREAEASANANLDKFNTEVTAHNQTKANLETARSTNQLLQKQVEESKSQARKEALNALRERLAREFQTRIESRGSVVTLNEAYFTGNPLTALSGTAGTKLDVLVDFLKQTNSSLTIEAMTTARKTDDPQFKAAEERARVVMNYLITRGVAAERVQAFAKGFVPPAPPKGKKPSPVSQPVELVFSDTAL